MALAAPEPDAADEPEPVRAPETPVEPEPEPVAEPEPEPMPGVGVEPEVAAAPDSLPEPTLADTMPEPDPVAEPAEALVPADAELEVAIADAPEADVAPESVAASVETANAPTEAPAPEEPALSSPEPDAEPDQDPAREIAASPRPAPRPQLAPAPVPAADLAASVRRLSPPQRHCPGVRPSLHRRARTCRSRPKPRLTPGRRRWAPNPKPGGGRRRADARTGAAPALIPVVLTFPDEPGVLYVTESAAAVHAGPSEDDSDHRPDAARQRRSTSAAVGDGLADDPAAERRRRIHPRPTAFTPG
ncbi:MAG: hypothetical protein R3D59_17220 [Paracoccaceae bacterium]